MGCIRSAAESAQQARSDSPPHFQAGWETVFLFGNLTRPSLLMMSPKVPSTQLAISKLWLQQVVFNLSSAKSFLHLPHIIVFFFKKVHLSLKEIYLVVFGEVWGLKLSCFHVKIATTNCLVPFLFVIKYDKMIIIIMITVTIMIITIKWSSYCAVKPIWSGLWSWVR